MALVVYAPSFAGPFVSDDLHYVAQNPYVQRLDAASLAAIWDPRSSVARMVENYAPVHLTLHGLAWQAFGERPLGHHVVNVVVHTLACLAFAGLLLRRGLPPAAAAFGGAFLLLHPANVEAVAWISQLKSSAALLLSLLALLAFPRRVVLASLLFALALFAKPTAAYAWPVAAWWLWTEPAEAGDTAARRRAWLGLGAFGLVFALFAVAELAAFEHAAGHLKPLHADPWVRARTVCAIAMRYLVLAASGAGASAFHEPPPALSPLDAWWLAALPALGLVAARSLVTFRARRPELGFWLWAGVSFAPISQVFPFLYPMADRYLYFILPGLVGAVLLALRDDVWPRLAPEPAARARARWIAGAIGAALLLAFAAQSAERARIWSSPALLVADAAKHYPDGVSAQQLRAKRLAQGGDVAGAVAALRVAYERGYNRFEALLLDPGYAPLQGDPAFRRLVSEMASFWIDRIHENPTPSQIELHFLAQAHVARGETVRAIEALERAEALPGPAAEAVRRDLAALRARGGVAR
jgi:hypothetical protein